MVELSANNCKLALQLCVPLRFLNSIHNGSDTLLASLADHISKMEVEKADEVFKKLMAEKADGKGVEVNQKIAEILTAKTEDMSAKADSLAKFCEGISDEDLKRVTGIVARSATRLAKALQPRAMPKKAYSFNPGAYLRDFTGDTDQVEITKPEKSDPMKETIAIRDSRGADFRISIVCKSIDISQVDRCSISTSEKIVGSLLSYKCENTKLSLGGLCNSTQLDQSFNSQFEFKQQEFDDFKLSFSGSVGNTVQIGSKSLRLSGLTTAVPNSKFTLFDSVPDLKYNLFKA